MVVCTITLYINPDQASCIKSLSHIVSTTKTWSTVQHSDFFVIYCQEIWYLFPCYLRIYLTILILTDSPHLLDQTSGVAEMLLQTQKELQPVWQIFLFWWFINGCLPAASSSADLYKSPIGSYRSLSDVEMSFDLTKSIWEPRSSYHYCYY